MNRDVKQIRSMQSNLKTRAEQNGEMYIEGYFAVYNQETELWPGAYEEIAPVAFDDTLSIYILALVNHDPN